MKQYEITYLSSKDENSLASKEIESLDGKIISSQSLGQKDLFYKIKKEKQAYLTSIVFEIEGEKIPELNQKLALKDEILRYLIVSYSVPQEEAVKKTKKTKKPEVEKVEKEEVVLKPIKTKKEEAETKPEKKETPKVKTKVKPKVEKKTIDEEIQEEDRLKALDEKLNELLKE